MDVLLNWALRGVFWAVGLGAALWIFRWLRATWRTAEERWPLRLAVGMLALAGLYVAGHVRLLAQREALEEGRQRYARFGDPRRTELRRAEVRGWIFDCTGEEARALATYRARDGVVERTYPLGGAGANLVGGGPDADERDYTLERLFAGRLRDPKDLGEMGELHPAGTDLQLTLCAEPTEAAWDFLRETGYPGAVVAQDVATGEVVAYAATGGPEEAPLGLMRYFAPGSVFKLALAALWWEQGLPDDVPIPCPPFIQVTERARIQNSGGVGREPVIGPVGMLLPSCNTAAVWMALEMRERVGANPFVEAYERYGFRTYADEAPRDTLRDFWATESDDFRRRLSPPPSRIRISEETGRAEWAQLSIGQGPVDVTVIGVSRFLQGIANDGVMLQPTLEPEALEARDRDAARRIMSPEVSRKLQEAMRLVVDRGTARAAAPYLQGTGWDLGGKTGTAQVPGQPDNGWFAGIVYGPDERPRYTVVVLLERGGPGSRLPTVVAGRLAGVLARQAQPDGEGE